MKPTTKTPKAIGPGYSEEYLEWLRGDRTTQCPYPWPKTFHEYTLAVSNGKFFKASEIIAKLDASVPLQNAHIQAIKALCHEGMRYSYQDCDVLSAAYSAVGKTEVAPWEAKWVEAMNLKGGAA